MHPLRQGALRSISLVWHSIDDLVWHSIDYLVWHSIDDSYGVTCRTSDGILSTMASHRRWTSDGIHVGLVIKGEARLAAAHQFRMCSLSMWLAGCETGFTFAYAADVN